MSKNAALGFLAEHPQHTFVARMPVNGQAVPRRRAAGTLPIQSRSSRDTSDSIPLKELGLRARAWRTINWREGTHEWLSSRFARVRVRVEPRPSRETDAGAAADR
jgi:hypothetical protein